MALKERLNQLAVLPPGSGAGSPIENDVSGRRYDLPDNEMQLQFFTLDFSEGKAEMECQYAGKRLAVSFGRQAWMESEAD